MRGAPIETVALHVPVGAREHGMAGGRQCGGVRALPARDEADARARREAEEVERPLRRNLLDRGSRGRKRVKGRALVPRGDQPVGGQRGRQRAADDEAEVPRTGRGDDPGFGARGQGVDYRLRVLSLLGQWAAEHLADRPGVRASGNGPLVERLQEALRVSRGCIKGPSAVEHPGHPTTASKCFVELLEQRRQTPHLRLAHALIQARFDLLHELSGHREDGSAAVGCAHQLGAAIVGIRSALDVPVLLQVGHELGHRLLGHVRALGEDADPRAGVVEVLEDVAVGVPHLRMAALGQPFHQFLVHRAKRLSEQDPQVLLRAPGGGLGKSA